MSEKKSTAAVLRSTDVNPEPRTERAIDSLLELDFEVVLLNWQRSDMKTSRPQENYRRLSFAKPANYGDALKNLHGQMIWQRWIARNILSSNYNVVYACDADTAIIALLLKRFKKYVLIYDQFDPISSRFQNKYLSFLGKRIEKFIMSRSQLSIVASKSRKLPELSNQIVVSNYHNMTLGSISQRTTDSLRVSYFGILQPDRGLMELIDCLEKFAEVKLTVAGFGILSSEFENIESTQLRFLGKLDFKEGLEIIAASDVSYVMYNPNYEHNRNTASGKFFDSIIAGTPCIVAKGTSLANYIKEFNLGWSVEYGNKEDLIKLLKSLINSKGFLLDDFEANRQRFLEKIEYTDEFDFLTKSIEEAIK
jgi:glycosyltransferase involved in cell wall biosynthesis